MQKPSGSHTREPETRWMENAGLQQHTRKGGLGKLFFQRGSSARLTVEIRSPWPSQHESLQPWRTFVAGWDTVLMERPQLPSRIGTTEETPLLKVPTVVWCCGTMVSIGMVCCTVGLQSTTIRQLLWVPGCRPNRRMDIVPRRSHHSPRSWISVSYCTTVVTHIPGLLVVVSSDIVP